MEMKKPPFTPGPPMGGKPPFGRPPFDGKPPLGAGVPEEWTPPMADISWVKRKFLDVPYARESRSQCFDLFLPEQGDGPFPLLIHIHGGAFEMGDKRDDHMNAYLQGIKRGWAVASFEYRLSGEAVFPAAVLDCREAVRYIKGHADMLCIDLGRIAVIGGSAGGNLAAMLGMNIANGAFPGEEGKTFDAEPFVQACVDQFGPMSFGTMAAQAAANGITMVPENPTDMPESRYLGVSIDRAPKALLAQSNPVSWAGESMAPMLVQHGTCDHLVPYEQSVEFVRALREKGCGDRVEFVPVEGADHEDPAFTGHENLELVFKFLEKYVK